MKEKISLKLKDLVGKNNLVNLSERTIESYADVLSRSVTEETELTDDFYSKHLDFLKSMNGQIYADTNSRVEEFKKNYKPAERTATQAEQQPAQPEEPQWAKELREKFTTIETKLTSKEKAEMFQGNLDKAKSILKANGATNDKVLNIAFKLMDYAEDMTPEQIAEMGKSVYDSTYKDLYGEGAAPASSSSSSTEKPISQDDRMKAIEENQKKYRNQIV